MAEVQPSTSKAIVLAPTDEAGLKALCDAQPASHYWRTNQLEKPVTIVYVCGDDRRKMLQISRKWDNSTAVCAGEITLRFCLKKGKWGLGW